VTQALRALEEQRGAAAAAMAAARGREEARRAAVVDAVAPLQAGARARVGGLCGACFFGMVSWRAGFSVKTAFAADEAGVARLQRWTRPTCRLRRRRQSAVC
jgi:hypothetical protein